MDPGVPVDGGPRHRENHNIKRTVNCLKNGFHVIKMFNLKSQCFSAVQSSPLQFSSGSVAV